ncbi:MAG TPA: hypothetical protein ENJ79_03105 [Gammaproteobacteria bacterium]|nr:hypothetical protein [Gammaproteobacteria bacterium]
MKKTVLAGLLPALGLASGLALAEGPYAGVKIGIMDADVSGFDDATNGALTLGYAFDTGNPDLSWALEAEFSTSLSDGDVGSGSWDLDTQALYGAVRYGADWFGKLRVGWLREDLSASVGGLSVSGDDTGLSAGLGIGWGTGSFSVLAEYTLIEEDIDFYSLGVLYHF